MAGSKLHAFGKRLQKKRVFEPGTLETGQLRRCLNTRDLTSLGVSSTLGLGAYVLVGSVASTLAGPAVVLSFLIAAAASVLAALCYAEFGSRVPRAGSAYIYTYVTIGEFAAFLIGWNIILETVFGSASVARGLSLYVDTLCNHTMSEWFRSVAPLHSTYLAGYFDFFAFFVVVSLGAILAFGVRESVTLSNMLSVMNVAILLFVIFAGAFKADPDNWSLPGTVVSAGSGAGGFFPYGVWGVLRGAAVCFYGFVGFDTISFTGEEVIEPHRSVPKAILLVIGIVFLIYSGVSVVVTLMVPYFLQDPVAASAMVFSQVGWQWAYWIVVVGAVCGITASLNCAMFPLPRLLYAMASDGFLFRSFQRVSRRRKSPVLATLVSVSVVAVLAAIMDLHQLIMVMCVGTLSCYTVVACCVIVVRYKSDYVSLIPSNYMRQAFGCGDRMPSKMSSRVVNVALILFVLTCAVTALVTVHAPRPLVPASALHAPALLLLLVIAAQPRGDDGLAHFQTPLVPLVPCISIYANVHLMVLISGQTWIRVAIWLLLGIPVYFLGLVFYRKKPQAEFIDLGVNPHTDMNGKQCVQITVEAPTPPETIRKPSMEASVIKAEDIIEVYDKDTHRKDSAILREEVIVMHAVIENNEEKEAKIIDMLDKVLQAEEDAYGDVTSLTEHKLEEELIVPAASETIPTTKSFSNLSDAGSDASLGVTVLSKYDVIAQVHREDMPKVSEDINEEEYMSDNVEIQQHEIAAVDNDQKEEEDNDEQVTYFNESETNSRTDESGYSDSTDKNNITDDKEDKKPVIPNPPPMNMEISASPVFKKTFTMSVKSGKSTMEKAEVEPSRESVESNNTFEDNNMVFGSDRQMNFMSKLNNLFQNKITNSEEEIQPRRRSNSSGDERRRSSSTGNVGDSSSLELNHERPKIFMDLKKELLAKHANTEADSEKQDNNNKEEILDDKSDEEPSLSREDLKHKLENIFATGGARLIKPRNMKSNPPTPEESHYQTDASSTESIAKLPKIEKNDTLTRQKNKFGAVLNLIRLSFKDDLV